MDGGGGLFFLLLAFLREDGNLFDTVLRYRIKSYEEALKGMIYTTVSRTTRFARSRPKTASESFGPWIYSTHTSHFCTLPKPIISEIPCGWSKLVASRTMTNGRKGLTSGSVETRRRSGLKTLRIAESSGTKNNNLP